MKATLHFLGLDIDLFYIKTSYKKEYHRYSGIPVCYNQGGLLYVEFPYGESHIRLLERMTTLNYELYTMGYPLDDGKILFYDANGDRLKKWVFKDAAIVKYNVIFDPNRIGLMVNMVISPAIQDYGCKVVRHWHITPLEEQTYQSPVYATEERLRIVGLEGPFDIVTGKKLTKGISRFKDYHYIVELNKPIPRTQDIYWGQSLDDSPHIKALLTASGRNLRGGHVIDTERKRVRVQLRFGKGNEKFNVHACLNNRYQKTTSLSVRYNKVVGIVTGVCNDAIHDIELYEVEDTGYTPNSTVVKDTQDYLGGEPNDAHKLFYDIKTPTSIILDGVGGASTGMKEIGGSIRFGTKAKPFSPKYYAAKFKNLDGFRGNQYTKVRQLTKIGRTLGKVGTIGTIGIGGIDISITIYKEKGFGKETQQAAGSFAGGFGGAALGGKIGIFIGTALGGVGAIPGGIIGAIIGGYLGGKGGESVVEYIQKD